MTPTDAPAPPGELTVTEAAAKYKIPRHSLGKAVERGVLPARKIGPIYLVDAEAARLYGEVSKARRALNEYTGRGDSDDE